MVPVTKPMLWGIGNHSGPCSEASDRPEGQEQDGGAAGGQEALRGVKFYLNWQSAPLSRGRRFESDWGMT